MATLPIKCISYLKGGEYVFYVGFLLSAAGISYFIKAITKGIVTHIYGNDINGLLLSYGLSALVILTLTYMMSSIDMGMMYLPFLVVYFVFDYKKFKKMEA
jgi:hypothetical protein